MPNSEKKNHFNFIQLVKEKPKFFSVGGLVLLIAVPSFIFIFKNKSSFKIVQQLPFFPTRETALPPSKKDIETTATVKDAYLTIAKDTLDWLDQQRDDRGVYLLRRYCEPECDRVLKAGESGHDGIPVIWARAKYYERAQTAEASEKLTRDLKTYTNKDKIPTIQTSGWNCRFMHDLWQSPILSKEQKEMAYDICWDSNYYRADELYEKHIATGYSFGSEYERVRQGMGELDIRQVLDQQAEVPDISQSIVNYYVKYPSDYVTRYMWDGREVDLVKAQFYFKKALKHYAAQDEKIQGPQMCYLGVSSLDMYRLTNKHQYYQFAKDLADRAKSFVDLSCVLLYAELAELAPQAEQNDETNKVGRLYDYYRYDSLKRRIDYGYDHSDHYDQGAGTGGFYNLRKNGLAEAIKIMSNNGLIIGLLLDK